MSNIIVQIVIILAIVLSIYLGSKLNKNTGIIAIAFSYIIACFIMGKSSSEFMSYWPINVSILQIGVAFFYGFSIINGTMDKLARKLIYPFRNNAKLIPFSLFFISALLTAMGADSLGVVVFMGTLGMSVASSTGMNPVLVCVAVVMGVPSGNSVPWASVGAILRGYLDVNFAPDIAANYAGRIAIAIICTFTVVFIIMYFIFKGYKCNALNMDKPDNFNKTQKKSLLLILTTIALLVIPQIINKIMPTPLTGFLVKNLHVYGLVYLFGFISTCLKLADEKEVFAKIPWSTILTLAGIMMLIELGTEVGIVETFLSVLSGEVPAWVIFAVVTFIAALMSMFSNSLMVVGIMLPFAKQLAVIAGLTDPSTLVIASVLGAYCSDIAPFSSGGALIMTLCEDENQRAVLFKKFFANVFLIIGIIIALSISGWFKLF